MPRRPRAEGTPGTEEAQALETFHHSWPVHHCCHTANMARKAHVYSEPILEALRSAKASCRQVSHEEG